MIRRFVLNKIYDDMAIMHARIAELAAVHGVRWTVVMPYQLVNRDDTRAFHDQPTAP